MKKLQHLIEAALLTWLFAALKALPLDLASATGSFIARAIGPFFSAHRTAQKNLAMIFPELTPRARLAILAGMWDNLGRVAAEYPHLPGDKLTRRVIFHGAEHLPKDGRPVIFISGHLGNWELTYPMASDRGLPVTLVYRQANNLYADKIICALRAAHASDMFPKGAIGAVRLGRAIKDGKTLAMLIDQKMNDGISVPFFGREAMTAPAVAQLALRYNLPIIPARIVRTKGAYFDGFLYPPLSYEKTGNEESDVLALMTHINALLESWIREHPEQWFWVHKRWPAPLPSPAKRGRVADRPGGGLSSS